MNTDIENWFENKEDEFINALTPLIAIDSTKGEPSKDAPFGIGPKKALDYALDIANKWGLKTNNIDGYVGTVDINDNEDKLHILAHLDVVGIGDGWDTNPFELVRQGDTIFGRGTDDDKGPAIAAMLALKCVKELNLPLKSNVKLILGTDEESGSKDIEYYYKSHPYAPNSITPDAEFPIINVEKGHYTPIFKKNWKKEKSTSYIKAIDGGIRTNVAPGNCKTEVIGLDKKTIVEICRDVESETKVKFDITQTDETVIIDAIGKEAHASTPDEGLNAITATLYMLSKLPLQNSVSFDTLKNLQLFFPFGDNSGKALGIAQEDKVSGKLTLTFSLLHLDENGFWGQFDARCPQCANKENLTDITEKAFEKIGCSCEGEMSNVHIVDEKSNFIKTLLNSYEEYSGKKGYCMAIGGGTYVHDIPGGVAFGAGDIDYDSHLHGANERARISQLMMCSKIYADIIIKLCS